MEFFPGQRVTHKNYGAGAVGVRTNKNGALVPVLFDNDPIAGAWFAPRLYWVESKSLTLEVREKISN
jgi:hypothetical protein